MTRRADWSRRESRYRGAPTPLQSFRPLRLRCLCSDFSHQRSFAHSPDSDHSAELGTPDQTNGQRSCALPRSNSQTQKLTTAITAARIRHMKKHVADLPLELILYAAKSATQRAAVVAVEAGRIVTGWKDGKLVEYGPSALPLVQTIRDENISDAHVVCKSRP